nr:hypothetical protein CDS [Bradyrhizobium sp.]
MPRSLKAEEVEAVAAEAAAAAGPLVEAPVEQPLQLRAAPARPLLLQPREVPPPAQQIPPAQFRG